MGGKVIQISAKGHQTCALLQGGSVRCWGEGMDGQLGYGNMNDIGDDETPASAGDVDVGGKVVQIEAGDGHTCAVLETGALRCWGFNKDSGLGYGTAQDIGDDETPASAGDVDVGGKVVQVSAVALHTCAVLDTGAVRCWGDGADGQLGYGNQNHTHVGQTAGSFGDVDVGGKVKQVSAGTYCGGETTCALLDTGSVRCWGFGGYGQLGYDPWPNGNGDYIGDDETPASAGDVNIGGKATQILTGCAFTCALLENGQMKCWGLGDGGALGYGNTDEVDDPSKVGYVPVL